MRKDIQFRLSFCATTIPLISFRLNRSGRKLNFVLSQSGESRASVPGKVSGGESMKAKAARKFDILERRRWAGGGNFAREEVISATSGLLQAARYESTFALWTSRDNSSAASACNETGISLIRER